MALSARPNVLVVDDDFAVASILRRVLIEQGLQAQSAPNGLRALELMAATPTQLVITDYGMPLMNGAELCHRIAAREEWSEIPIILMSATYRGDVQALPQVRAYFRKPVSLETLVAEIRRLLAWEPPR